ncbi:hypothetical protein [Marilutibacter alkalisoli]|uniref:Relaxation protein n=1 Tax=Marilutibacter alkalisoli TaxID=2591633 RepID=A0A514BVC8_9GAMM|nr:hypothetical protein [Lysobacter alkalisoli]QDH71363.1 hypothetical protein FKV23_15645 [Lysobacter alkalisoli]
MQDAKYQELINFLEKAALLAADLERRCLDAAEQQQDSAKALVQTLHGVEGTLGEVVTAGKTELLQHAQAAVRQALAQEVGAATKAIGESANQLRQVSDQLKREQSAVGMRMRIMGWKSMIAIGAAAFLTVAGSSFVLWHNVKRTERLQVQAEVMQALQHVTVTSCDGRPCMKLEEGQPRWGKNQDYILVDTSTSGSAQPDGRKSAR